MSPKSFSDFCKRVWRKLLAVVCVVYREGRQALLDTVRAQADLKILEVEKRRIDVEFQPANNVADLAQKLDKIEDPQLRRSAISAISSSGRSLQMTEMHGRLPGSTDAAE